LHNKEQEINLIVDKYDKKLKSMQTELEERDNNLSASRETISSLNQKCKKFEKDLEIMSAKK
jgi:predicted  nucleic acid-binding Zn-ribbon protein